MTSTTLGAPVAAPLPLLRSTIGRKVVMAVTGIILVGFVVGHMAGNLQVFLGAEAMRHYALFLRAFLHGAGIWIARTVMLLSVGLHIWAATSLTLENRRARPRGYRRWEARGSTLASRTMRWSGYLLLAYILYHLLDLTFGAVNPGYVELEPYRNLVASFQRTPVALAYIGAMVLLGFHLDHGVWSMLRTLGLSHPRWMRWARGLSILLAVVVVLGYISIPIAVMAGALR